MNCRLESFKSFLSYDTNISRLRNQTIFGWYQFDVNVVRVPIATYKLQINMSGDYENESEYIVKFKYCSLTCIQNFMSVYEKSDSLLTLAVYILSIN